MAPSVKVNGHWVGNAGTSIQHLPGVFWHLPFPIVASKAEGEIFMGSSTVQVDGSPFTYQYLPSLSCNLIGIPAPPRAKKMKKVHLSLFAPTVSMALVIPAGKPVMVGGPPTVDLFALAIQLGLKGLGKLWKTQGVKAFDKLFGVTDDCAKWKKTARCMLFGEPVDAATGRVYSENDEFRFPGAIPFVFKRRYFSDQDFPSPLGRGWHHSYDIYYFPADEEGIIKVRLTDGRFARFPVLEQGQEFFHPIEHLLWKKDGRHYLLEDTVEGIVYQFEDESIYLQDKYVLVQMYNPHGDAITLQYDHPGGKIVQLKDTAGRLFNFEYSDSIHTDRLTGIIYRPDNKTLWSHRYKYDEKGLLSTVIDTLGATKEFCYNEHGLLISLKNQLGGTFHWEYKRYQGGYKCVHTWGDNGMLEYHADYQKGKTIATDSLGNTTVYEYNERFLITRVTDPEGGVTHFEYDDFENLMVRIDPLGNSTKYQYDKRGNVIAHEDACGETTRYHYDQTGKLINITSPSGESLKRVIDEKGRVSEIEYPNGSSLKIEYKGDNPIRLTNSKGQVMSLVWDGKHNLVELQAPNGGITRQEYDEFGRVVLRMDADRAITRYEYDLAGNLVCVREANGNVHKLRYNEAGQVLSAYDAERSVLFEYGILGDLLMYQDGDRETRFFYDTERRLKSVRNERDEFYRFTRDGNGLVVKEVGFDGAVFSFERNLGGQLVKAMTPVRTMRYDYTPQGFLSLVEHEGGLCHRYGYDADGRLVYADNGTHQVRLERAPGGAVSREIQNGYYIEHSYDKEGEKLGSNSSLGVGIHHQYDSVGSLVMSEVMINKETAWTAKYSYDIMGREVERLLPGNLSRHTQYDVMGFIKGLQTKVSGHEVNRREYEWSLSGMLRRITSGDQICEFDYDKKGNLIVGRYNLEDVVYRISDRIGNLFHSPEGKGRAYERGGRIREDERWKYTFDAEGFLMMRESKAESVETYDWKQRKRCVEPLRWTYEWNGAGQLERIKNNQAVNLRFEYDALGRRVAKINESGSTKGHTITRFLWNGDVPLHEWTYAALLRPQTIDDAEGWRSYVTAEPQDGLITWIFEEQTHIPCAKIVDGQSYSILCDHLGTPYEAYSENGELVWRRELDVYGRTRFEYGVENFIPFLYQGQYLDIETGLAYNRFRYYSPELGSYISQDPIRLDADLMNLYAYVFDPNTWIDPLGLDIIDDAWEVVQSHINNSGTTVLGHFPRTGEAFESYIEKAQRVGASYFDMGSLWDKVKATGKDPWELNKKFLDKIISKGHKVLLNVPKNKIRPGSYLEQEIRHLQKNGYKWVNQ